MSMRSTWFSNTFLRFLKFPQIKEVRPNFLGRTSSAERLNYLVPPSCISILVVWRTQNLCHSLDFNAFYMIQQYFSQVFEIFVKLKEGGCNFFGLNQFCITAQLFGPLSCISILKVWRTQILCYSLHFNAFYMMQ